MDPATDVPRVCLLDGPTPLQEAPGLGTLLERRVLVKRDDLMGFAGGGNKVRKLEFLLADALQRGAQTVITTGGLQTNHGRLTAAAAARLGLRCELVLTERVPVTGAAYEHSGNILLDQIFGAVVHRLPADADPAVRVAELVSAEQAAGRECAVLPLGGSNPLGCLGYVAAAAELAEQLAGAGVAKARVVVALGSCGTAAGIVAGSAGRDWHLDAVTVLHEGDPARQTLADLVNGTAGLTGVDPLPADRVRVVTDQRGAAYGIPTAAMWTAVVESARRDGLLLDPVYTGKAAAHLFTAPGDPDETLVFWHTGGLPGLFAYADPAARALAPAG